MIKNKNILIGITGGIAAYKICELIRLFKKNDANVKVVATKSALEFVTPLTLETLSQEPVYIEQFSTSDRKPEHISLCDWADVFVIAPASANSIGKIANGICDNLLTSLACAYKKQIFIMIQNGSDFQNILCCPVSHQKERDFTVTRQCIHTNKTFALITFRHEADSRAVFNHFKSIIKRKVC